MYFSVMRAASSLHQLQLRRPAKQQCWDLQNTTLLTLFFKWQQETYCISFAIQVFSYLSNQISNTVTFKISRHFLCLLLLLIECLLKGDVL